MMGGESACQSIIDVAHGRVPKYVVSRDVLEGDYWKTNYTSTQPDEVKGHHES